MAIDTRNKRASAACIRRPWGVLLPAPDGTVGQPDRQHLLGVYAGISTENYVDSAADRGSAISAMRVAMRGIPLPAGGVTAPDQYQLARAYSGISAGVPENTAQVLTQVLASAVGTINASGTCAVSVSAAGALTTPPTVQTANITITASASGDVIETTSPVDIVVTASAAAVSAAGASCAVSISVSAAGVLVTGASCAVAITSSAREASTSGPTAGVADVDVQVLASALGQFASSASAAATVQASAIGTLNAIANSQIVVSVQAFGDDGVPDPVSASASVSIGCLAVGSVIAPSAPAARGPTSKSIDFKSLTDYYGRRSGRVAVYRFGNGRQFYERDS